MFMLAFAFVVGADLRPQQLIGVQAWFLNAQSQLAGLLSVFCAEALPIRGIVQAISAQRFLADFAAFQRESARVIGAGEGVWLSHIQASLSDKLLPV
ncbi:MAG: hypothetical protein Kow00106_23270 [Anaerolineae bacterium]